MTGRNRVVRSFLRRSVRMVGTPLPDSLGEGSFIEGLPVKTGPKPLSEDIRFLRHVKKTESCWLWVGARAGGRLEHQRYGYFGVGSRSDGSRRRVYAHRWMYEHTHSPIPEGKQVNHTCDTPLCVNPAHLVLATQSSNVSDMHTRGRARGKQRGWLKGRKWESTK